MMLTEISKRFVEMRTWSSTCNISAQRLTREGPQLIHTVFIYILSICGGYYSKKKPKRIWADAASFNSYDHFTDLSIYYKPLTENLNDGISTSNIVHI